MSFWTFMYLYTYLFYLFDTMEEIKETFLFLSSYDRNVSSYPQVNSFVCNLDLDLKNIIKIEILNIQLPNSNNVLDQGILFLSLTNTEDINKTEFALNSALQNKIFIPLFLKDNGVASTFISPEIEYPYNHFYPNKINVMSRLGFSLYTRSGSLFDFGESAGDLAVANQTSLLLKIYSKST
jgi:hypothetical protein